MRENEVEVTCARCERPLDTESDHYVEVVEATVDVRTARKETDERVLCAECGREVVDAASSRSLACPNASG